MDFFNKKMKKNILVILLFFAFLKVSGQTYNYKFTYSVTFQIDPADSNKKFSENMVLLTNNSKSLYISPVKIVLDSIRNSAIKNGGSPMDVIDFKKKLPRNRISYSIEKKYKENKVIYQKKIFSKYLEFEEQLNPYKWELINTSKKILGYTCKLAKTTYKGRVYEAWYAPKIPLQNGPWKFGGLPGLILKISDNKNHYSFIIKGIKKEKRKFPPYVNKSKVIKTTKENYYRTSKIIKSEFLNKFIGKSKLEMKKTFKNVGAKSKNPIELED